jgi:hypothetical protein
MTRRAVAKADEMLALRLDCEVRVKRGDAENARWRNVQRYSSCTAWRIGTSREDLRPCFSRIVKTFTNFLPLQSAFGFVRIKFYR